MSRSLCCRLLHKATKALDTTTHDKEVVFIAIEGPDGTGKTTFRRHINSLIREKGAEVLSLQGQSWSDRPSAEIITNAKYHGMRYPADVLVSAAVRDKEVMSDRILRRHLPWRHILSDRYVPSDVVYYAALWDIPVTKTLRSFTESHVLHPDLVLHIDTPPDLAWKRLKRRPMGNRHPWESAQIQERVHQLFQEVIENYRETCTVLRVDNSGSLEPALAQACDLLRTHLERDTAIRST